MFLCPFPTTFSFDHSFAFGGDKGAEEAGVIRKKNCIIKNWGGGEDQRRRRKKRQSDRSEEHSDWSKKVIRLLYLLICNYGNLCEYFTTFVISYHPSPLSIFILNIPTYKKKSRMKIYVLGILGRKKG